MTATIPTEEDFPAAHSMDATWFAVDRDGHIGVFDSGDPGAVPAEVNDTSDDEVLEALEPLPVIGEPRFELSGVFHPGLRPGALPERRVLPRGWPPFDEMQSLLLSDESLLTPEVRALPGLEVGRAGQFVLVSLEPTIELAQNDPRWTVWDQFKRVVYKSVIDLTVHLPELNNVLSRALRANIETEVAVPDDLCAIKVDPNELRLALLKLAIRAGDVMPKGGRLSIAVRPVMLPGEAVEEALAGEFVAIRVADTGAVIPANVLPHVFEAGQGTGSALSEAYSFARQSGGTATITSGVGQGTVITLYLPRTHEVTGPLCISSIALMDPQLAVARRGLFAYSAHEARFNRPGLYDQPLPEPYGLVLAPKRPLRLDEAAPPLRKVLATRARLNVAFASSPYIQPAELVPSVAWGDGVVYLASDGCTIRPFPATQAALYRQAGDLLRSDSSRDEPRYKPLLFDPPLDHGTS